MLKKISLLSLVGLMSVAANAMDLQDLQKVGNANWRIKGGTALADAGSGFLVTREAYADFYLKVEFFAEKDTNSGIFFRCVDAEKITDKDCYEANIFDSRPDPTYRTGGVTNIAAPKMRIDSEGRWNTYEIIATGPRMRVILNGLETVNVEHEGHVRGPIALQYAKGGIAFRNLEISSLETDLLAPAVEPDLTGVWELTGFTLDDGKGNVSPWCEGAHGVIIYTQGYMSVAINCQSNPAKMVHYSGPYEIKNSTAIHSVRNFSDPSLKQVFRRAIKMKGKNRMDLEGPFGNGGKAVISWKRR